MKYYIAIDVGGTKVAYGLFNENKELAAKDKHPADPGWNPAGFVEAVAVFCERLAQEHGVSKADLAGIGMALPGYIDIDKGYMPFTTNIPGLRDYYPAKMLEERMGVPVKLDNDANVAGLGEARTGAARGRSDIVYITISTGVGGGIILNNHIYHGANGSAGEVGHVLVTPGVGALCGCTNRGCVESYVSGRNMKYHLQKAIDEGADTMMLDMADGDIDKIDGRILEEACKRGDALALKHLDQMGYHMGILCFNLYQILNIDCYVFGGGLSNMGDMLISRIEDTFRKWNHNDWPVRFLKSMHGGDVGIYGAVELFFDE